MKPTAPSSPSSPARYFTADDVAAIESALPFVTQAADPAIGSSI